MVGLKKSSICLAYQKRRLREDLITVYRNLHGENIQVTKGLFNPVEKSIKRANGQMPDKFR